MADSNVAAFAEKMGLTVHFLHNDDPDFEGEPALCDHEAGERVTQGNVILSVSNPEDVTCQACKEHMAEASRG